MKFLSQMFRQGDVLVVAIATIPVGVKPEKPDAGRAVLAYGEVTGHAHALEAKTVKRFKPDVPVVFHDWNCERFIRVVQDTHLRHEEHGHFAIPVGDHAVIQQREYHPEEIRRVAD